MEMTELTRQINNAFSTIKQERAKKLLAKRDQNIKKQKALRERARRAREKII